MVSRLRWRKILRELAGARTPLVVLCLAIGAAIVGTMITTQAVLNTNIERQLQEAHGASALLIIPEGFDRAFVDSIRRMPEVEGAEGRGVVQLRINTAQDSFVRVVLFAIEAYDDIRINTVTPEQGAWPPKNGEIWLERSSLSLRQLQALRIGDSLAIEKENGKTRSLRLSGLTYDFNQSPSLTTGLAYGYITLDTLESLGFPRSFNQLSITVSQNTLDERHIRAVADRVEQKIDDSGRTVAARSIPEPGKYPLSDALAGLGAALVGIGALTLVGGLFLVINTINALLAQQMRQIGIMKAIGARTSQLVVLYMSFVVIYSLLAALVALPLAAFGGRAFSGTLGAALNIKMQGSRTPFDALAGVVVLVFIAPMLAALYPILAGARTTVREAMNAYGVAIARLGTRRIDRLLERIRGLPRPVLLSLRNTVRRTGRLVLTLIALMLSGTIFIAAINVRAALVRTTDDMFSYRTYQLRIYLDRAYRIGVLEQALLQVPGVRRVESHAFTTSAWRTHPDSSIGTSATMLALDPTTSMFSLPIVEGRWLDPRDRAAIVVNAAYLRKEPDIRLGDTVTFTINQREKLALRVVGITEQALTPPSIYLTKTYFDQAAGKVGTANGAWVAIDTREPAPVVRDIEAQFAASSIKIAKIDTVAEEKSFIVAHTTILTAFLQVIVVLLVIVGGLGLMGTMSINVIERRREIGIMRAVGASDRAIQSIVIVEGIGVGLLSWLLSVLTAAAPTKLIGDAVGSRFLKAPLAFTFVSSGPVIWLLVIVVVATLACVLPARNAAQAEVRTLLAEE